MDTSVWVDHFRTGNARLVELLLTDQVLCHPLVIGELACGTPPNRAQTMADLASLRPAHQASIEEVIRFVEDEGLAGLGCGLVDMLLLASTIITSGARLWTLDRRLAVLARRFDVAHRP